MLDYNSIPKFVSLGCMKWRVEGQVASGGFGRVYSASSEQHPDAVMKFIPKTPGAGRELLFEELTDVPNVVPVLDHGEWDGCWVLVMPRAEKSLREQIEVANGPLPLRDAIQVLIDISQPQSTDSAPADPIADQYDRFRTIARPGSPVPRTRHIAD